MQYISSYENFRKIMVSDNVLDSFEENVENFADIINRHRVDLVKYIDFDRQLILTYLQSKNIIDEEDIYLIKGAGPSRQQQVSKFLDVLARTGVCGYKGFLEVLEMENADLFKLVTNKKALKRKQHTNSFSLIPLLSVLSPIS